MRGEWEGCGDVVMNTWGQEGGGGRKDGQGRRDGRGREQAARGEEGWPGETTGCCESGGAGGARGRGRGGGAVGGCVSGRAVWPDRGGESRRQVLRPHYGRGGLQHSRWAGRCCEGGTACETQGCALIGREGGLQRSVQRGKGGRGGATRGQAAARQVV